MADGTQGVETTSPVANDTQATGDTQSQVADTSTQTASEGVKTPEGGEKQQVPYERFQEVNNKAKSATDKLAEAERKIAEFEASKTQQDADDELSIDPEAEKTLQSWARKQGLVTKEQFDTERMRLQVDADVNELKREFDDFDKEKVLTYADENGLNVTNKAGLKSVYNLMQNSDTAKVEESIRNKVLAELKEKGQLVDSGAERPGVGGAKIQSQEQDTGLRGRLNSAIAKHRS